MKKQMKINHILTIIFSSLFLCISLPNVLFAEAVTNKGLTLSPLRSELSIDPGTSVDGTLVVKNQSKKPMEITMTAEAFSVINQQYDYSFTAESSIAKWVTFNQSEFSLKAGGSKKITFTVGVPLSAEPGGRYISMFASTDTGEHDNGIQSRQRIASLLYINILGDVSRSGHLVSFSSPWLIGGNSGFSMAIQDNGTTHFRSRYSLRVKGLLWNETVSETKGDALILPGTIRLVSDKVKAPKIPGIYKAEYLIGLGDTPAEKKTNILIYMPLWFSIILIAILTGLIYWFYSMRNKSAKKKN
jgi:hypothetical protein